MQIATPSTKVANKISITSQPTRNIDPPTTTISIADTGSTGHFFTINNPALGNVQRAKNPITVELPNGDSIISTHTGTLPIQGPPPKATLTHTFPELGPTSLLSIGVLCDEGCVATFTKYTVTVTYNDQVILTGTRNITTNNLWQIQLPQTTQPTAPQNTANAAAVPNSTTLEDRVKYSHACLFSPVISTLEKAIQKNFLTNFPGLTIDTLRKYPPQSPASAKGHLKNNNERM